MLDFVFSGLGLLALLCLTWWACGVTLAIHDFRRTQDIRLSDLPMFALFGLVGPFGLFIIEEPVWPFSRIGIKNPILFKQYER